MTETTTTQRAPMPDPALMELDVLAGDWRFEGDVREGSAGPAARVRGTTSFEWFEGGWCLVQHADTVFGGTSEGWDTDALGDRNVTIQLWWYDSDSGTYRTQFFSNNGGPSGYEGRKVDGVLTFEGPARYTMEPSRHGTVVFDWSLPDGDGGWVPWMSYTMTRID
jgi:hypothetical protein